MLISHLNRLFKNRWKRVLLLVLILMPTFDLIINYNYYSLNNTKPYLIAFVCCAGCPHLMQELYYWIMPVYFMLLIGDDVLEDITTGYKEILVNKVGKKKYCIEKLGSSFLVSFFIMLIGLLINLLFVSILFHNGSYEPSGGDYCGGILEVLYDSHPYLAILGFSIILSLFAGMSGALGAACGLFYRERKLAYAAAFFVWYLLVNRRESIVLVFQPFDEYPFSIISRIFGYSMGALLLVILTFYIYVVKYDE